MRTTRLVLTGGNPCERAMRALLLDELGEVRTPPHYGFGITDRMRHLPDWRQNSVAAKYGYVHLLPGEAESLRATARAIGMLP